MPEFDQQQHLEMLKNDSYLKMLKSKPKSPGRAPTPRPPRTIVGFHKGFGEGTKGVPGDAMERLIARLIGIKVGTTRVVTSVEVFGSRAGSTFVSNGKEGGKVRTGTGPHRNSDVDMVVGVMLKYYQDPRKKPWIKGRIEEAVEDFTRETDMPVDLHVHESIKLFKKGLEDPDPAMIHVFPSTRQYKGGVEG